MSWICKDLRERVQILIPRQTPNDENGSLDLLFGNAMGGGFESGPFDNLLPVKTIWMGFKPLSFQSSGSQYIRGEQINENVTHQFKCRKIAVDDLGKSFSSGFAIGYKFMPDLASLKSNYFLFVERGSSVKGRLFKIHDITDNREDREYLKIGAEEIEERGTGFGV
jgi:hypothetical protein